MSAKNKAQQTQADSTAGDLKVILLPVPVSTQPEKDLKLLWAETAAQSS